MPTKNSVCFLQGVLPAEVTIFVYRASPTSRVKPKKETA